MTCSQALKAWPLDKVADRSILVFGSGHENAFIGLGNIKK